MNPTGEHMIESKPRDASAGPLPPGCGELSHLATLQHMALLANKRDKLETKLQDAEEQFVVSVKRDWDAGLMTALQLLEALQVLSKQNRLPEYSKRWRGADLPTHQKIAAMVQVETNPRTYWNGSRHGGADEIRPQKGICVVYVLFHELEPVYVGSTKQFAIRLAEHRKTKEWTNWIAHRCRDREHAYALEEQWLRSYKPRLNVRTSR